MYKILWLSPNFNHYKARFLNHFADHSECLLTVIAGTGRGSKEGDKELRSKKWIFNLKNLEVSKKNFGTSLVVQKKIDEIFSVYDWVLIPAEKKNLPLFLFSLKLRRKHKKVKLFSYNHPVLKSGRGKPSLIDKSLTWFFYYQLDRVIFYTEESCHWAVKNNYLNRKKAFWANNTIDTNEVKKFYDFSFPPENNLRILFIGRLIPSKKIGVLLEYYSELKEGLKKHGKNLKLDIIGNGPDANLIEIAGKNDKDINWYGTLVDEHRIAPIMANASFVFVPGHSGLSINHAFAYGRPYFTLKSRDHAPEIDYLQTGRNGMILGGIKSENIKLLTDVLLDRNKLEDFCLEAKKSGEYLSVENWREQFFKSLSHE